MMIGDLLGYYRLGCHVLSISLKMGFLPQNVYRLVVSVYILGQMFSPVVKDVRSLPKKTHVTEGR